VRDLQARPDLTARIDVTGIARNIEAGKKSGADPAPNTFPMTSSGEAIENDGLKPRPAKETPHNRPQTGGNTTQPSNVRTQDVK
jgi:hypothetical protein